MIDKELENNHAVVKHNSRITKLKNPMKFFDVDCSKY